MQQEEEQESLSPGGSDEDSEDDTADHGQVVSFNGPAQVPSGYKILDSCPSLETDENLQELIDTQILHAWTTRTGRDGSREQCMSSTSPKQIMRVLPLPIWLCDTRSR